VGFISKWYLLEAAYAGGYWYAGFLIVASSLIALVYVGRVAEVMLLREPATEGRYAIPKKDAPLMMLIPMWALVAANIYFGVRTDLTAGVAERAAEALMMVAGGAP
ncbi:MAG: monovalent cation/H+ antiporter subunit D family protein, partial [Hyphococcus sp.]